MKHYTEDDLIDYIHGELGEAEDARIYAHLADCPECTARYEAEAAFGERLRSLARADEREMPSIVKAHVWAAIRDTRPSLIERLRAYARPLIAVPVAAAVAFGLYLSVPAVRGIDAGAPTVAAAYYLEEHAAVGQVNPLAEHTNVNAAAMTDRNAAPPLIDAADAATLDDVATSS